MATYTKTLAAIDARLARIEAILVAGAPAQASAATSARPATDATSAEPTTDKVKVRCPAHGKAFTVTPAGATTGTGFHAAWCKAGFEPVA